MRFRWLAGAVVVLGLLLMALFPRTEEAPGEPAPRAPSSRAGALNTWKAAKHAVPTPTGSLRITGVVRDARGPVPGVRVTASRVDAETLSERPCPEAFREDHASNALRLTACAGAGLEQEVARLVEAREGEAPVFAETVSAQDGTFTLEGLPSGAFALWALGEHGAVLRPDVPAGSEAVELGLEEGIQISGTVTEALGRTPIPGARVTVVHEAHTRFFDVLADEQGRFRVGPLPPGRYLEVASAQGWRAGVLRDEVWLDADVEVALKLHPMRQLEGVVLTPQGLPAPGLTVNLRALFQGADILTARTDDRGRFTFEEVPAVEHHLWVWNAERTAFGEASTQEEPPEQTLIRMEPCSFLEGTVRDDQGRPLEGVRLKVNRQTLGDAPIREALTDEAGHYRLGPLLTSALDLFLTRAHFMNKVESIPRRDGVTTTWDFTLARAMSVEGSVVDTEGRPLAGVEVGLSPDGVTSRFIRDRASQLDEHTVSDEAGRFLLDTEQEGTGRLFARATDFISTEVDVKVPSTEVRVVLQQGASVSGIVVDAKGAPMTDVTVKLWDTTPGSGKARTGTVDGQGGFSLRGLKAGHYMLEAWRRTPGMAQSTSLPIELEEHTQAVVALRFEEGRTLEGMTVDTYGQPIPGVQVRACLPLDDVPPWQLSVETCDLLSGGGVRSGPDGHFVLKHLVAPTYQLVAWKEDQAFAPARSRGGTADASSLHVVPGGAEVRLVMERRSRLKVRVVSADGRPLPSSLWVHNDGREQSSDGAFDVVLRDDSKSVVVSAEGFFDIPRSVVAKPGEDVDLGILVMTRSRKARFIVRDEANPGSLAGVPVSVFTSYDGNPQPFKGPVPPPLSGNLDTEGAVDLDGLPFTPIVITVQLERDQRSLDVALDAYQEVVTVTVPARPR
ncbi:carboxypeptidase-like regulatory domain-containing protein [Corallococcus sp. bb12-1]|uniref:carboxypeptidase-like regulatory domain-containing protein n=1 Tax=Corallococcus sp. bb12-1 TaxID=2996784 RepID=UPI0022708F6F|nr:carboxypeptidase-like regulatory domain-containing protein [Corallococcus sp. bb12-1]MCY1043823.1 carboxypeptidase-like regulatory domain-containing protein [Corallococcus sp. bb12-1]